MNLEKLLSDYDTLIYAQAKYNTITEREGVKNYEELALKEHYFEALVELCKIYNIECDIDYNKKLSSILNMESEATYKLKEMILEFEK